MSIEPDSATPVRFGVVGGGWLGIDIGRQAGRHDAATVTALADVDAEARRDAGEKLAVPPGQRYADHETMFAEADVDAAVITTPHGFHYEQITAALDADLHVLCEKPLCIDVANAREIVERVESSDRTLMVGYQRHLNRPHTLAREHVRDADEITAVDAEITQPWIENFDGTWRTAPDVSGGGVSFDTGNHLIDGLLWVTGLTPAAVSAEMDFHDDDRRVDAASSLSVEFENGIVGSIGVSGRTSRFSDRTRVWTGEDGVVFDENEIAIVEADGDEYRPHVDRHEEPNKVEAFIATLRTGEDPPATARDSYRAVALTDAAYESARTGERVEIDLPLD